jgi:hypothetical protein
LLDCFGTCFNPPARQPTKLAVVVGADVLAGGSIFGFTGHQSAAPTVASTNTVPAILTAPTAAFDRACTIRSGSACLPPAQQLSFDAYLNGEINEKHSLI